MDMREMTDKVKRGLPLYGEVRMSDYMQGVAARNSRYTAAFTHVIPMFNIVNHNHVSVTTVPLIASQETNGYAAARRRHGEVLPERRAGAGGRAEMKQCLSRWFGKGRRANNDLGYGIRIVSLCLIQQELESTCMQKRKNRNAFHQTLPGIFAFRHKVLLRARSPPRDILAHYLTECQYSIPGCWPAGPVKGAHTTNRVDQASDDSNEASPMLSGSRPAPLLSLESLASLVQIQVEAYMLTLPSPS